MRIVGIDSERIIEVLKLVVKIFSEIPDFENKNCGYFTILDVKSNEIILHQEIGFCPEEKKDKYRSLSLEKAKRLYSKPHDTSSFQSRNPSAEVISLDLKEPFNWGHWGGAIRIPKADLILSFSGLPELGDEAVMLVVALQVGWITNIEAQTLACSHSNGYYGAIMCDFGYNCW